MEDVVASALTKSVVLDEEYLLQAFRKFDRSGDGELSFDELAAVLGKDPLVDKELVAEAMAQADTNGDGRICFEEFASAVREKSSSSDLLQKREKTFSQG
jgi:Ca2+-binding EF-hand superfamily protein